MLTGTTARSWALFRAFLGTYLLVHFAHLFPWAAEVFSSQGMAPSTLSPLFRLVPSLLWISDSPLFVQAWVVLGAASAVALTLGIKDRWAAAACLWVLAGLFAANPLIANPSLPHVGWILLAHSLVPSAPTIYTLWRDPQAGKDWRLPPEIVAAGWAVAMLAYGYSGYTKLSSASWVDGTAMWHVLSNPLARPTFLREWLLYQPTLLLASTWAALALELAAPLLALSRAARPALWLALLGLQLGLLVLVDFADLTWGMFLVQAWLFDPTWLRPRAAASAPAAEPAPAAPAAPQAAHAGHRAHQPG